MKIRITSIGLLMVIFWPVFGQQKNISESFKEEINKYLSFTVPTISIGQLEKEKDKYLILDARERDEYDVSHIPGSRYVGYDFFKITQLSAEDKSKPVVVYCSIGYRSEKIGERLHQEGFEKVYNLYGSIFAWANAGFTLEDNSGKTTNRIHGYNEDWSRWITGKQLEIVF